MTSLAAAWAAAILLLAELANPVPLGAAWAACRRMAGVAGTPSVGSVAALVWGAIVWAALQFACLGAGTAVGRWIGRRSRGAPLDPLTDLCLGWLGAGLVLLGLGLLGIFRPALLAPLALTALVASTRMGASRSGGIGAAYYEGFGFGETPRLASNQGYAAARAARAIRLITVAVLAAIALNLLAPETHVDALIYHLGIAGRAVSLGRLTAPSGNFLHHFPLLTELLRGWGLALGGEPAARLWTLGALVAGAVAVRAAVARIAGDAWGWAGFGLWATSPLAAGTALEGKPDIFTAAFAVVAMAGLARGGSAGILTAGLLAGAAAGTKLHGFVVVAILAGLALGRPRGPRVAAAGLILAGVVAAAGPWLAKSVLLTGDPVYPFGKQGWGMSSAAVNQLVEVTRTMALRGRYDGWFRRIAAPWTATMTDGLPALWLALVPFALLGAKRAVRPWWIAGAIGWIVWATGPPQPRYAIVPLAWLTVGCVVGLAAWRERRAATALAAACLILQAARTVTVCAVEGSWGSGLGLEARDGFRRRRLTAFAETVERLAALPAGGRIMYSGEWRSWPAPRATVIPSLHEPLPAWPLIRVSRTPEELARRWRQLGVTRVLHDPAAALYHRGSQTIYPWTIRDLEVWSGFWRRHARLVRSPVCVDPQEGGYYVYEVTRATGFPHPTPTLPGVEGPLAVVEAHLRRGDLATAAAGLRMLDGIVGDVPEVIYFTWSTLYAGDPDQTTARLEAAEAGGYRDSLLWEELARLADARGRPAEAAAWRRRAEIMR